RMCDRRVAGLALLSVMALGGVIGGLLDQLQPLLRQVAGPFDQYFAADGHILAHEKILSRHSGRLARSSFDRHERPAAFAFRAILVCSLLDAYPFSPCQNSIEPLAALRTSCRRSSPTGLSSATLPSVSAGSSATSASIRPSSRTSSCFVA